MIADSRLLTLSWISSSFACPSLGTWDQRVGGCAAYGQARDILIVVKAFFVAGEAVDQLDRCKHMQQQPCDIIYRSLGFLGSRLVSSCVKSSQMLRLTWLGVKHATLFRNNSPNSSRQGILEARFACEGHAVIRVFTHSVPWKISMQLGCSMIFVGSFRVFPLRFSHEVVEVLWWSLAKDFGRHSFRSQVFCSDAAFSYASLVPNDLDREERPLCNPQFAGKIGASVKQSRSRLAASCRRHVRSCQIVSGHIMIYYDHVRVLFSGDRLSMTFILRHETLCLWCLQAS